MRIHLGHHFYGAGNLGDDFMLGGFIRAIRQLAPHAVLTASVPFDPVPLRRRFTEIQWEPYTPEVRVRAVHDSDAWLGLGGSPFQSSQSRWFIDHLLEDARLCAEFGKPMYYLGVGVQTTAELASDDARRLISQAGAIWTRDPRSAEHIAAAGPVAPVRVAADLAHLLFRETPPPPVTRGRFVVVPNFDYGSWPGMGAFLETVHRWPASERIWLAQETRPLPSAERSLYASLSPARAAEWRLVVPDGASDAEPCRTVGDSLPSVLQRWPSGEWLVTSRYHAAIAAGWAGANVVVIDTNEKLRAAAALLGAPTLAPDADAASVQAALKHSAPARPPIAEAEKAFSACREFVSAIEKRR
ncbi:MAG TPA: polysaccharide pyruvyl transferase family protein [Opitutaceae bacterium]|nr:polysaccharide pyruvyl transferase family protein [Opitutaceae bacterium]